MGYLFLVELGLIASHIAANKHHFQNIFLSFAVTFVLKKFMKSMGEKDKAGLVGLAGYSIALSHILLYFADISKTSNGTGDIDSLMKRIEADKKLFIK